ncbi:MAG TPA: malto-oligosyltrehalose synthase [Vicinamibacterales bacterium]|nr:malto-oligosyltrehalose synthase [Vicinamibacterales bacterium]
MYVPISTYRLQLHAGFPFAAAEHAAAYLARLGVGACYTSPAFTAGTGSTHGYDVCDHNAINPELGGEEAHQRFVAALAALGLGHVADIVPNHMGIGTGANQWWRDVLENGPGAAAARFFDIDWTPVKTALHAKLLLPILGDQYGRVLERGEIKLVFRDGLLVFQYFEHELPVNPRHVPNVLRLAVGPLTAALGADSPQLHEFLSILTSLQNLPNNLAQDPAASAERHREKEVARSRLSRLVAEAPEVLVHIENAVRDVNGEPGRPESFNAMHELLENQSYRLSYWRTASHDINYRRFFDINTLAGLRVEDPEVFAATHQLIARLVKSGAVQALRVDHPDGLFDPARYFSMLQDAVGGDCYVVAEKILSGGETLPAGWRVAGTTGYNFLNDVNGVFVQSVESRRLRRAYAKLTGRTDAFDNVLYDSKRLIMTTAMASELNVLAHALERLADRSRRSRDFTLESLRDTITEVVACFPVYRTYVDESGWTAGDRAVVERAIGRARRRNPAMESSLFDFFREVVMPRSVEGTDEARFGDRRDGYAPADDSEARDRLHFTMKFQQYSGPVQAKGLEDTSFFRYNLLLSLNEVGGDAERVGRSVEEFHAASARRLAEHPFEMIATATHDTKLGEDTRARINAISELTDVWARDVARWMRINRAHRTPVDGDPAPDRNDEYRFYQALVGVWPAEVVHPAESAGVRLTQGADEALVERLKAYMIKSVKEAKLHTSWLTPNEEYENAVATFVQRTLTGAGAARFLPAFLPLALRVARIGMINGLAQVTLKLGAPGVPDFYQGTELWDTSLVDPDNRRPVDFDHRARLLDEIDAVLALPPDERAARIATFIREWPDGRIKLLLTAAALRLRRERPDIFLRGHYVPISAEVGVPAGIVAFARLLDDRAVVVVAPRLTAPLISDAQPVPLGGGAWKTSRILLPPELASRTFTNRLTGARLEPTSSGTDAWLFAGKVFETVPVAILTAD